MNLNQLPEAVAAALAFLAFVTVWSIVLLVISAISGWRQLARRYRCSFPIVGATWRFQSAGIRCYLESNYNSCLTVKANDEGIGLSVQFPFRIGHPPLFIPWSEVEASQVLRWFLFKRVRLKFPEEPSVWIELSNRLAGKIQTAIGQDWFQEAG